MAGDVSGFGDRRTAMLADMVAAGVIDPAKVTCTALQNSASVSALMLTVLGPLVAATNST